MLELNSSKWKTKTTIDLTKKKTRNVYRLAVAKKHVATSAKPLFKENKNQLATNSNKILL